MAEPWLPSPLPPGKYTNLDLVSQCDNFPYENQKSLVEATLTHGPHTLGYLTGRIWTQLRLLYNAGLDGSETIRVVPQDKTVTVVGETVEQRSANVDKLAKLLRDEYKWEVLKGWRDELYSVYAPRGTLLFRIERAACHLFGLVTYGVHMTGYVWNGALDLRIWVPRRSLQKQTYGGMLDNTVAGGIASGETPVETLIREAKEEASLSRETVLARAKICGTVTYFHIRDERAGGETGLFQPECEYVCDMDLTGAESPRPNDDEVEDFHLWKPDMVQRMLADGQFKPNSALVMLDFFVRHGILTPENEPDYVEIISRIHRKLDFPTA